MTFPTALILAMYLMVPASFRKGLIFFQKVCDESEVV
jgi:hypothetical protein